MGYTAEAVVAGVWLGVRVALAGAVHRGAWEAGPGTFGRVRTDCGASGLGHLSGSAADCVACEAKMQPGAPMEAGSWVSSGGGPGREAA